MYWSVVIAKPGNENRAIINLERQGFVPYLPKYMSRVGKEIKIKVLFPRYFFVQIEQQWHRINSTFGVSRIMIGQDSKPVIVSDKIIEDLKMREDKAGLITLPEPTKFQKGQQVRVATGPLEGYTGLYDGMRPNDRVRVLIEMLGQQVHIELSEKDLAPVVTSIEDEKIK